MWSIWASLCYFCSRKIDIYRFFKYLSFGVNAVSENFQDVLTTTTGDIPSVKNIIAPYALKKQLI